MNCAKYLSYLRKNVGLSKSDLARKIKVSPGYIMNIENEHKKPPTGKRCEEIANALNLDKDQKKKFFELAYEGRVRKGDNSFQLNIPQYEFDLTEKDRNEANAERTALIKELNKLILTTDSHKIDAVIKLLKK